MFLKTSESRTISYPLIRTRRCAYQGVRNIGFSDVFRGIKGGHWGKRINVLTLIKVREKNSFKQYVRAFFIDQSLRVAQVLMVICWTKLYIIRLIISYGNMLDKALYHQTYYFLQNEWNLILRYVLYHPILLMEIIDSCIGGSTASKRNVCLNQVSCL